jgi:hypothetical protein
LGTPAAFSLLAQGEKLGGYFGPAVVGEYLHGVVADGVGRPEADNGAGGEQLFIDDALEHGLRVVEELGGSFAYVFVGEDARVAAFQLPGLEERGPVDVGG